jgi:hypothetical protein
MEGAHFSTVYRGLPDFGGQPLPRHKDAVAASGGFYGPRFPSARARAIGPSEPAQSGKCRRCLSGVVVGTGIP